MADEKRSVLIIGGAKGIGKSAAQKLLAGSYNVIVADCDNEALNALRAEYADGKPHTLDALHMDITDKGSVSDAIRWVKEHAGLLDAAVISAAVHSTYPVEFLTDELIHKVIDANLIAHIKLVRDILPHIKDGGRVVGVSSIAAGIGIPMSSMYSASKAGLEMFYESLAAEISYRDIKPVLIHPGNVNTGFNETGNDYKPHGNSFVDEAYKRVVSRINSRYGISPEAVADVIVTAVTARSPKFCYVVGANALKAHWAKRLLGRNMSLKVMTRYFGI